MGKLYDRPCSKCGVYVLFTDPRNTLGDLADHRLCPVSERQHVGLKTSDSGNSSGHASVNALPKGTP